MENRDNCWNSGHTGAAGASSPSSLKQSRQSGYSTPFRFKSSEASAPILHPSASHHSIHTAEQQTVKIIICIAAGKEYYRHYITLKLKLDPNHECQWHQHISHVNAL